MRRPPDRYESLPFFAYGVFKPGELAFFRIAKYVESCREGKIQGCLLDRDGLPIASRSSTGTIPGYILWFREKDRQNAYDEICDLEPTAQYDWATTRPIGSKDGVASANWTRR
jgi:hypothetical protein